VKLLNYDSRTLIYNHLNMQKHEEPQSFTRRQYDILCHLIRCRKISKPCFQILLQELHGLNDWRQMNYRQMYETIFVLTHWK